MKLFNTTVKKLAFAAAVAIGVLGTTAAVLAWGPSRRTFTMEHPAPYVTFNSITNNPNEGDERAFFEVKDAANTNSGGFRHTMNVKDGQTLLVRTYVHNNAASNLNDAAHNYKGIAKDAKVRIWIPSVSDDNLRLNSYISASNAKPGTVYDNLDLFGERPFTLDYVEGSAVGYTNAVPRGMKLSDSIVGANGAPIGYTSPNGKIPGCLKYDQIVTIKVKVKMPKPAMTISKQVAIPGQEWKENVTVNPGDTVSYLITMKNTGNTVLNHVSIRDKLPANMKIVSGTTKIYTTNTPNGLDAGSDEIVGRGIDIGSYGVNGGAYVKFKATVDAADKLKCGMNKLTNTGEVFIPGKPEVVKDTADVYVNRKCDTVDPFYECSALAIKKHGGRKIGVTVDYKAENGAVFKHAYYDFGDGKTLLSDDTSDVRHTYAKDGDYTVRAQLTFRVNGQDRTVEAGANCTKNVSFETPDKPEKPSKPGKPTVLPNTGAGDIFGMFTAVTIAGGVAHRAFWGRRFNG